jgi:TRAP transporter 4TM/12TM fusion protein
MPDENKDNSCEPKVLETVDTSEILRQFDAEARVRQLQGYVSKFLTIIAVIMSLFHLYMAGIGTMPSNKQRMIHLALTMVIIFLSYSFRKKSSQNKVNYFDYLLAFAGFAVNAYLFFNIDGISERAGLVSELDIYVGFITIVLVLEAARRCVGFELSMLACIFLAYAYLGPYLPGPLMHRGYSFNRLVDHMFISAEGIYGIALGVSSTYIFLFILFGAFLGETGLSKFFTNVSMAMAGDKPGGPAKVAIIASGFLGMINGSAAANVATTGAFTIPLMKCVGYRPHFAGAVEAVASTGGQIMPPVMGAAAFIMAEFLGISYKQVCIAALIPSVLYYLALWANVHLEALKLGLKGIAKEDLPSASKEFKESGHLLIPIVLLVYLLFADYTPSFACFYSIVALVVCSFMRKHTRLNLLSLIKSLDSGARGAVGVAIACAVVGIIVGVVSITGLGLQLANMILTLADGRLIPTLILSMIACMVLGMGMPTSAAYIVAGTVAAPAMVQLGVEPIIAHMFVLYFAVLSAITPPVALAAYAGAGIAGADPAKVGWTAVRLGLAGFIVPFMFVFSPGLVFQSDNYLLIIRNFLTATVGIVCLACALQGYLITFAGKLIRFVLFVGALLLIHGDWITDVIGLVLLLLSILWQKTKSKKETKSQIV